MKSFCVLVVDDEPRIVKFLVLKLKASGYEVLTAGSGFEALQQVQEHNPDMVILDLIMPGMDGFEVLKEIRAVSSIPLIILSARETNIDKIKGLKMGADDYLAKPFSPDELVARIEAVRRRLVTHRDAGTKDFIKLGNITVNLKKHVVIVNGKETSLTRIEWLLLTELSLNAGKLMLYSDLLARIWGTEYLDDVQILRTWVSRLRNKIEKDCKKTKIIRTVPKTGYIIDTPASEEIAR